MLLAGVYSGDDWRLIREVSLTSSGCIVSVSLISLASFLTGVTFVGRVDPMRTIISESVCKKKKRNW
jgi:hypothetical protein